METAAHVPVLLQETIEGLAIAQGDLILDATLGGGGHSAAMCEAAKGNVTVIGMDADNEALERARGRLSTSACGFKFVNANFREVAAELDKIGIGHLDKALFDLGLGSHTYDAGRGFSFQKDEPLVMTLSDKPHEGQATASDVVNSWSEETLREIMWAFGDERYARVIAHAIIVYRERKLIETSRELADLIKSVVPATYRFGRIHPATKSFQAIRIAVNDEMNALDLALRAVWERLNPKGRIAVISFHSLEDRIVKRLFREWAGAGYGKLVTKRPLVPTEAEIVENPRSRSAKLRIIEKLDRENE